MTHHSPVRIRRMPEPVDPGDPPWRTWSELPVRSLGKRLEPDQELSVESPMDESRNSSNDITSVCSGRIGSVQLLAHFSSILDSIIRSTRLITIREER